MTRKRKTTQRTALLPAVPLVVACGVNSTAKAQETSAPVKVVQVIGLTGVKQNAKGSLKIENGTLHFVRGKNTSNIAASSIQDVVSGDDTQRAVGGTLGLMSMAAPYGGGRFLLTLA